MEKINIKQGLIQYAREIQYNSIKELKIAMEEAQKSANDYGAPRDRYDSYRNQMMRKRDMFAKQLKLAQDNLMALDKIPMDKKLNQIEFGAIVVTSMQNLFVSISLGKIDYEGKVFYAISPNVPIFNALSGKKVNDEIVFNGNRIKILSIE